MLIVCSHCQAKLQLDESKLKPNSYTITCPKCQTKNKAVVEAMEVKTPLPHVEVGWLVLHDENTNEQTHPLKLGKNVVGRGSESKPCDIMIDTDDMRMSRNHSVIEVSIKPNGQYEYLIYDCGSTNGTYINGDASKKLTQYDMVFLRDGDTIQMGRTKMVLKTAKVVANAAQAAQGVKKQGYTQTVAL
jgi:predicted Zn finger-like uncharacterized protein